MIDKVALRGRMRQVCETVDDRLIRSVQLWVLLADLPEYAAARTVMAFASMPAEPDTDGLFARLHHDGKKLVLPRLEGGEIVPAPVINGFTIGQWGIREPDGDRVDPATVDLVVVPGVAFTLAGDRLGHGKGYYDRFLAGSNAPTVGACFTEQIVDELPVEPHDVRLQHVIHA
ncbi:MAG: 5,10-methenyltetrahydrofolate synthetase [Acidimicrobiaceae bacterium]|nr:MAG: 5,10-methenyltetrahydrofolate synthetase [Acidimicrobiaceae bacterium]